MISTRDFDKVAERVKELRIKKEYSLQDLADRTGLSKSTLQRYETGAIKNIPVRQIPILAKGLGCPAEYLLDKDIEDFDIFSIPNIIPIPQTEKLPILGTIACGTPILAEENIDNLVAAPYNIKGDFALRCKGDSMINARINDGDIAIIKQQPTVENGEIAAVIIDDEATLKRVTQRKNIIILKAENPNFQDIIITADDSKTVRIIGKATYFISTVK